MSTAPRVDSVILRCPCFTPSTLRCPPRGHQILYLHPVWGRTRRVWSPGSDPHSPEVAAASGRASKLWGSGTGSVHPGTSYGKALGLPGPSRTLTPEGGAASGTETLGECLENSNAESTEWCRGVDRCHLQWGECGLVQPLCRQCPQVCLH